MARAASTLQFPPLRRKRPRTKLSTLFTRRMPLDDAHTLLLWRAYKERGSVDAFHQLIEHYAPMCQLNAAVMKKRVPWLFVDDLDTMTSDGVIGLMRAVEKIDDWQHPKLRFFVSKLIRTAIYRGRLNTLWGHQRAYYAKNIIAQARERLVRENACEPTPQELAESLAGRINNPNFYTSHAQVRSMHDSPEVRAFARLVHDETVRQPAEDALDAETLKIAIRRLKGDDRKYFRLAIAGKSIEDIAARFGVKPASARARINGVLWRVRIDRRLQMHLGVEAESAPRRTAYGSLASIHEAPPARRIA